MQGKWVCIPPAGLLPLKQEDGRSRGWVGCGRDGRAVRIRRRGGMKRWLEEGWIEGAVCMGLRVHESLLGSGSERNILR